MFRANLFVHFARYSVPLFTSWLNSFISSPGSIFSPFYEAIPPLSPTCMSQLFYAYIPNLTIPQIFSIR